MKRIGLVVSQHTALAALTGSFIYGVCACLIFAHHHFFFRHSYFGAPGDPQAFIWFLSWWPYAVSHHLNPFITHAVWAPDGVNLTWTGSIPAIALTAWPITANWDPILSFNVATIAAPILSATAALMLCREITGKYLPSLIGGWLYGFSSYEMGHLMGHLNLDFTACVPTLVWLGVLRYRGKISNTTFIAAAAGLLTFQFGTSTEIFATATLFGLTAIVIAYVLRAADKDRLVRVAISFACAYIFCLIIVSPYLYYMVKGSSNVPPLIQPANVYVADAINYVVPTQITAVNSAWAASVAKRFTGNNAENGAYLGLPLLMIITAFAAGSWRNRSTQLLLSIFLVLVFCSFGPYLHFKGRSLYPMPWWLAEKLPLLRQVLPVRFSLYTSLLAGIIVALWLASLGEQQSMIGYMLALLAVLTLMPNIHGKRSYWLTDLNDLHTPMFFSHGLYKQVLQPGDNIIVLPYVGYATLWQATSGMYFRIAGGYVTPYIPPTFARSSVVQMFYAKRPAPGVHDELTAFCEEKGVRAIILTMNASREWESLFQRMHWNRMEAGGVIIYRIP